MTFSVVCILLQISFTAPAAPLRRPLSPQTPMFMFQVQQPDASDPQACINALPADVRPYTVMVYCMGAQSGTQTNGYAFADYFCNVAQQNGVWCMFQCASGYANTMANTNSADYERLIKKYPGLIGFAFAEQNWGFGSVTTSSAFGPSTFSDRINLFAQLLPIFNTNGCYLYSSEMQSDGGNSGYNLIHKLRDFPNFRSATVACQTNFIVGDKTTQGSAFYDNESCVLGTFLSGHAGYYASRCDETAWGSMGYSQLYGLKNPAVTNGDTGFTMPEAVHGMFIAEHFLLQGATVIDGPEYPRYSTIYNGQLTPCYNNTTADLYRKVLDGTIKIPDRASVLASTPLVYVSDSPNWWDAARTPADFYDGLYAMDGEVTGNKTWLKSSGRYSSIPETFTNGAYEMAFFKTNVLQTLYTNRWPTIAAKTNEFNAAFPAEYSTPSVFFAARRENCWLTYNPYINSNITTSASIPLRYNTCTNLSLTYPPQTFAVITESNQSLTIYFNNYFTDKDFLWTNNNVNYSLANWIANPTDSTTNTTRTTTFQISGCTNTPTYSLTNRGSHKPMTNSAMFAGGVFTLTLTGNGPCDIAINCSGSAARTNAIPAPKVMVPPPVYVPPVPAPPNFVSATPGHAQATVSWHATNCLSYNLKRGTSPNGPFASLATGITNSVNLYSSFNSGATVYNTTYTYADASVTVSNVYYYVVSGMNVAGEGPNSAVAAVAIVPAYTNSPAADAYVESSNPTVNFGSSSNLLVKNNVGLATRNAYLMFDVRALANVRSATVTLVPNRVDDPTVKMYYELTATNWTETGITWNNQPGGLGVFLATNTVAVGVPVVLDVANAAASAATNGGWLSLRVTQPTNSQNGLVQFCSREHPTVSWRPLLAYAPSFGVPPAALVANAPGPTMVNLVWPASSGAAYYNIRRAPGSGGPFTLLAQGVMTTNYTDTAANSGTAYFYAVSAVYGGGESANSPPANVATPLIPAPATLVATLNGNQVALNWSASPGAGSYTVKRAYRSGGPYTAIANGVTDTNYSDSVFFTGANYYYVVAGVDAGGLGTNSPEAGVTTPANLTVEPVADSYVEDGTSTNTNFGTSANLKVKNQGPNTTFTRITYLMFDLHALTNATNIKLKLTPYQVDGSGVTNSFELVTNNTWTETGITWNNQPGGSGIIITNVRGANYAVNVPISVDVTGWALAQATNDLYFSLRITDPNTNGILLGFNSKEAAPASVHPALQFSNPGNTAPTLPAIGNRTIGAGMTLLITNTAADTDSPPQIFTYSLPTAPPNAFINASNGVLTWRPFATQANTANPFTVMVSDSGTPTKSTTQNFTVTVNPLAKPLLSTPLLTGNWLTLQVNGDTGPDYQIQSSTNLLNWNVVLTTNSPALPLVWTTSLTNGQLNFFRILAGPPF